MRRKAEEYRRTREELADWLYLTVLWGTKWRAYTPWEERGPVRESARGSGQHENSDRYSHLNAKGDPPTLPRWQ